MLPDLAWVKAKLRWLADPLFWGSFVFVLVVKLAVFHFACQQYLIHGFHPAFGLDFEVVEAFSDFRYYYMNFVWAFVQGNLPYTEGLYMVGDSQVYIYPPLFLYILAAFYYLPSDRLFPDLLIMASNLGRDLDFLRVGFAFVVFDFATCVMIYVTARRLTEHAALPVVAMLLFALNPVALWWGDYLWLSTPIHTFFLVVGFYFMIQGKLRWAAIWVTVATMVKQTAALLLPVIVFLELRRGAKQALISLGIMIGIAVIFSLPYIVLYPLTYLNCVIRGMSPYWFYDELPNPTHPIPVSVLAFYWPEPFKFIAISAVFQGIPWGICLGLFWLLASFIPDQPPRRYQEQLLLLVSLLSLAMHIFFARGIYKFYLIAMLPFLILFGVSLDRPLIPRAVISSSDLVILDKVTNDHLPWLKTQLLNFRHKASLIVNNFFTWWTLIVIWASLAIFLVHRYYTHVILLMVFLILLIYGGYRYIWKRRKLRLQIPKEETLTIGETEGL